MADADSPFFSRWSRRKALVRDGQALPPDLPAELPAAAPARSKPTSEPGAEAGAEARAEAAAPSAAAAPATAPPPPTLDDVAELGMQSDYTRFVARDVAPEVKNAALKKLFTDPHFNIMDGLDTYIDDYGKPDPLPPGMLRQLVQSQMLGLFDDEETPAAHDRAAALPEPASPPSPPSPSAPSAPPDPTAPDEDTDLQLQPDPAAGRPGPEPGAGEDAGRAH